MITLTSTTAMKEEESMSHKPNISRKQAELLKNSIVHRTATPEIHNAIRVFRFSSNIFVVHKKSCKCTCCQHKMHVRSCHRLYINAPLVTCFPYYTKKVTLTKLNRINDIYSKTVCEMQSCYRLNNTLHHKVQAEKNFEANS